MRLLGLLSCCALVGACGGGDSSVGPDADGSGVDAATEPVVPGADPSFGGDGMVTIGFRGGLAGLMRVARQPDGKIVAVGGTQESLLIMRMDGRGLDATFGDGGVVQLPWGVATNGVTVGYGCAIQDDGKIVVAARVLATYQGLGAVGVVVRLLPDGSLDPDFAGAGYVVGPPGSGLLSLALQDDGRIVVGGYARLERLLADGTHDPSFGSDGVVDAAGIVVQDLVVQPDGAIVTVGARAIARFTAAGARDESFGAGGLVTAPGTEPSDTLYGVALQDDGKILAAGAMTIGAEQGFWIGRYDATGAPDDGFGSAGQVTGDPDTTGVAFGVGVDDQGRIVGSGYATIGGTAGRSVRFDPSGALDATFGSGGAGPLFPHVLFSNVAIDPDGAFTVAGAGFGEATTFAPVFARTGGDGVAGGELLVDVGGSFDRAHAVAVQPDGKILVGGWANSGGGAAVVRLEEDGTIDAGFAVDGRLVSSTSLAYVNALAATGDRILVGGLSTYGSPRQFAVEAYDAQGALDPTFGDGGVAGGAVLPGLDALGVNLATGDDGAIVVVGQTATATGSTEYGVVKLTADGDRDPSFGDGGAAATALGAGSRIATHAVIEPGGGVVVLGQSGNGPALVRFDAAGAYDAAFGAVVPAGATGMLPFGLARQPDGALVVVAGSYLTGDLVIARVTAAGAPDPSFGDGGVVTRTFGGNDYYGLYAFMGVAVLGDGRLVIGLAGARDDGLVEDGLLLRLHADGTADEAHGPDGVATVAIGRGSTSIHALAVDGAGRVLAAGRTWTETGASEMMALRLVP